MMYLSPSWGRVVFASKDADPGPTDNCDLMRHWTDLRSFELQGSSYSAWLCGWESDNDVSKIWMPNSDLIATIDRLARIRAENHTQGLGELLKPYIQGITRWQSTIPSGWNFQILRLPRSSFINSDDGKMMIYPQQIGQNCNSHKDCLVVLWHVLLFCGAISSFVFAC